MIAIGARAPVWRLNGRHPKTNLLLYRITTNSPLRIVTKPGPGLLGSFCNQGLGGVDSKDSLLGANQLQDFFWETVLGVKDRLVLSDATWGRMAPLVIGRPDQKGSTGRDNRMFVEGVLWIVRTGSPWRDLPEAFDRRARRPSRPDLNYSANALPTLRTSS
jgi:hypothetical protein